MASNGPLAIFRADGNRDIGGGHIARCRALADALQEKGWRVRFAVNRATLDAFPSICQFGEGVIELPPGDETMDAAHLTNATQTGACDLLVVDHYGLGRAFESACRPWAKRIMAIDDLADRPYDCEVLLDQTLDRTEDDYRALVPPDTVLLLGPNFALLRPEFAFARDGAIAARRGRDCRRVLVSMGAMDPDNITCRVLDGIARSGCDLATDVVLGDGAPNLKAVEEKVQEMGAGIRLHVGGTNMAELMARADIAVGAGGTMSWERCALGLPSLVIVCFDNQREVGERLGAAGAVSLLGDIGTVNGDRIAAELERLMSDRKAVGTMAAKSACIADGRGAARVVDAIDPWPTATADKVRLRPAQDSDCDIMYAWQSHPDTRRHFHNPEVPTLPEHKAWFAACLEDPDCLLNLILCGETPAGVLRLDSAGDVPGAAPAFRVSIVIAPDRRGMGIGRAALASARQLVPEAELIAEVLPGNDASHSLFRGAGYVWAGTDYRAAPLYAAA